MSLWGRGNPPLLLSEEAMPIYDIECGECGFVEERLFASYKNLDEYFCPKCGVKAWIKKPCNTNWRWSKGLLQKTNADQLDRDGFKIPHQNI